MLETFTELAGVACRNASAHAGLARAAQTDALTGCLNHAALHEQLGREIERAARGAAEPPSLVLIDLDHFKQVNEEHGHLTGDEVLRRVGSALRSGIRPYDVAARYGGDEFALIVTAADEDAAQRDRRPRGRPDRRRDRRVRRGRRGRRDRRRGRPGTPGSRASELVARADRALLHGKQTGAPRLRAPVLGRPAGLAPRPLRPPRRRPAAAPPPVPAPPMTFDAAERERAPAQAHAPARRSPTRSAPGWPA